MIALGGILGAALRGYRLERDGIHGPGHWLRVMQNGRELAARTPGADPLVIDLFALLHDCRREHDGQDRGHGERAATYGAELAAAGALPLETPRLRLLLLACLRHEAGDVSGDPTVGCCWDADRLELARLRRPPIARLLSTAAARDPAMQAAAWLRGTTLDVSEDLAAEVGLAAHV